MLTTIEVYAYYAYKINKKQTKEKFQMGMGTYKWACPGSAFDSLLQDYFEYDILIWLCVLILVTPQY